MKTKKRSQGKRYRGSIISAIVIAGIIITAIYLYNQQKPPSEEQWFTSGPFAINKNQYKIGEYVFMVVSNLGPSDVGNITIVDPKGDIFDQIPFNGTMKTSFHYYFKPNTERNLGLCKPTDLVGKWNLLFTGVPYKAIPFQIVNDWVPNAQAEIKAIDNC